MRRRRVALVPHLATAAKWTLRSRSAHGTRSINRVGDENANLASVFHVQDCVSYRLRDHNGGIHQS